MRQPPANRRPSETSRHTTKSRSGNCLGASPLPAPRTSNPRLLNCANECAADASTTKKKRGGEKKEGEKKPNTEGDQQTDRRRKRGDGRGGGGGRGGGPHRAPAGPVPYFVGNRLGMPINPAADGKFKPMSDNVKVYGSVYSAESCSYDPVRKVIVVPNRGVGQNVRTNDAWITFLNHDGSVHAPLDRRAESRRSAQQHDAAARPQRAAGQRHRQRRAVSCRPRRRHRTERPGVSVVRSFNMKTGLPGPVVSRREVDRIQRHRSRGRRHDLRDADGRRPESGCDDVAGVEDHTRRQRVDLRPGRATASAQRHRLRPPGQHRRRQHRHEGVIHVLQGGQGDQDREGRAVGNDGLVMMRDGTKYVSSVVNGGVSRIRPTAGGADRQNIPNPASMCYDPDANQLVIPMNANNALAVRLR